MKLDEPSLGLAVDSVLESLPPVWDRIRSNLRSAATGGFGITLDQFHILRHIRRGYQSVRDLAEKRQISRPAISQAVNALVVKGLVTRIPESADRRCVRLELTEHARNVLDQNFEENRLWMRGKMASLTKDELASVKKAMKILKDTFTPGEV
jgi:DNA-binding MarR family transcriptional regulator